MSDQETRAVLSAQGPASSARESHPRVGTRSRFGLGVAFSLLIIASLGLIALGITRSAQPEQLSTTHSYEVVFPQCVITDPDLAAISGMAVRNDGTWVANDRGAVLYRVNRRCKVAEAVDLEPALEAAEVSVTDVEDLAQAQDGWLWLADTGGNNEPRKEVRLIGWRDDPDGVRTVDLKYPKGTHDVEALAIDITGRAILITKESGGDPAMVFRTPLPIVSGSAQDLELVGDVELVKVKGSKSGSRQVTGAAVSPSGTFVTLRTYAHAWEFDAPDGDLAAAIVGGAPRLVPLADSEQGEAVAYTRDGLTLLTTGEGSPVALDRVQIERTS